MKYIDEYRNPDLAERLSRRIHNLARAGRDYNFMEVCGTHTNTFFKFGLRTLLSSNVRLISGPGCPVCVTDASYIDNAISLAGIKGSVIATYGDMIKVPGSSSSLEREKARGRDIRVVYSSLDALSIAEDNPSENVIFLAVGFETTAPASAVALLEARKRKIKNFFVYSGHKLIPPAMKYLLKDPDARIDGFILPAHVSAIIGAGAYGFLVRSGVFSVIAGFEPLDMLQGIAILLEQMKSGRPRIEIQYDRVVRKSGNIKARGVLKKVFAVYDSGWRGLGLIPKSGLRIRSEFKYFDAERRFKIKNRSSSGRRSYCICPDVLKGKNIPTDCRLFAKSCTPERPKGPCMVSGEGICGVYYRYAKA